MAKYKLSEIFELQMGKTPDRHNADFWTNGTEPWISIADLSKCSKYIENTAESISEQAVEKSGIKIIPSDTVVMSFKLSIGKVAITPKAMYSNEAIMAFISKGVIHIEPTYLYYLLMHHDWDAGTNKAVMGKTLNKATLSEMTVNVHEPIEQLAIVKVLDKASAIIETRRQQLVELDNLVKARFVEMFGGYSEATKLSEVASVTGGLTKNTKRDKLPLRMPYLRVANVAFASIDVSEMLDIGLTEEECEKTLLQPEDLLFVEGNGSPDQIGRVAIWKNEIVPCVHQNHLIKSRFNKSKVLPVFAMYYFMSQQGREQIKSKAVSTSGLYTLSVSKVATLLLPTPPMELQEQFAAFVEQVDKSKFSCECGGKEAYYAVKYIWESLCRGTST